MTNELSHYDAIRGRIARETERLNQIQKHFTIGKPISVLKKMDKEISFRERQIDQAEKELAAEIDFLFREKGIDLRPVEFDAMTDDELLKELMS